MWRVNYHRTLRLCDAFQPLLAPSFLSGDTWFSQDSEVHADNLILFSQKQVCKSVFLKSRCSTCEVFHQLIPLMTVLIKNPVLILILNV